MNTLSLLSNDAKYFDDSSNRLSEVRSLLDSKEISNKLDAMKCLLAMISLGRDVSNYYADVVKNIISDNIQVKKLVYIYIIHYSSENNDLALLSINTLQKELTHQNPQIRANAIKAMSSIRIQIVIPLVLLALKTTVKDTSAYVRRATASAIPKVYQCDQSTHTTEECIDLISELLNNTEPTVLGSALYAYSQICPNKVELLHKHIRKICHLLADFDEWGQIIAVDILLKYGRTQFADPNQHINNGDTQLVQYDNNDSTSTANSDTALKTINTPQTNNKFKPKKSKAFYSDDESDTSTGSNDSDTSSTVKHKSKRNTAVIRHVERKNDTTQQLQQLDEDHRLLLKQAAQLLYSTNAGVTIAVTNLYIYLAPQAEINIVIKPLIRAQRGKRYIQYTVFSVISTITTYSHIASLFSEYITEFYVFVADPICTREAKLDILYNIANTQNINTILIELTNYLHDQSQQFVCLTIQTLNRLANKLPSIVEPVINLLMQQIKSYQPTIIAQSIVSITQLLQLQSDISPTIIQRIAKLLKSVHSATARTSIIWIIGEYHNVISEIVPDILRILCLSFTTEDDSVKLQILNLSVKLYIHYNNDNNITTLFKYIMELCRYDMNYDIRDRTRLLRTLLFKRKNNKSDILHTADNDGDVLTQSVKEQLKQCFILQKPAPTIVSPFTGRAQYQLGTITHLFNQRIIGYIDLIEFPDKEHIPDTSVRKSQSQATTPTNTRTQHILQRHKTSDSEESSDTESVVPDTEFSEFGSETDSSDSDTEDTKPNKPQHKSTQRVQQQRKGKNTTAVQENEFVSSDDNDKPTETSVQQKKPVTSTKQPQATVQPTVETSNGRTDTQSARKSTKQSNKTSNKANKTTYDILDLNSISDSLIDTQSSAATPPTDVLEMNVKPSAVTHNNTTHATNVQPNNTTTATQQIDAGEQLQGYTRPQHSVTCTLLNPATSGGLATQYQFIRKQSMYGQQYSVIDLQCINQSNHIFENITFTTTSNNDIKGLDQSVQKLPVNETYTVKLHIDCNGKTESIPIAVQAQHGTFKCKLQPLIGELIQPQCISIEKYEQLKRRMSGGFSEHSKQNITMKSIDTAINTIYSVCNVIGLKYTDDSVYRFVGYKLSDDTPLLIQVKIINDTLCTVHVYMDDMLNGGHVLDTVVKALQNS